GQGPTAAVDLIAQSGAAGSAALLIATLVSPDAATVRPPLAPLLAGSLMLHVLILLFENVLAPSPTRHHELAVATIRRGPYARLFWALAIAAGGVLPIAALVAMPASGPSAVTMTACVLALAGGAAWEYIWVEAG